MLSRSPFVSDEDDKVFGYVSEVMGELLAHSSIPRGQWPNGVHRRQSPANAERSFTARCIRSQEDEARYYAACEDARVHKNYAPLALLIANGKQAALYAMGGQAWRLSA